MVVRAWYVEPFYRACPIPHVLRRCPDLRSLAICQWIPAELRLNPRDDRDDAAFYELIGDDDGVFGCMSLLGCEDVCPKDLSLGIRITYLRRAMLREAL